METVGLGDVIQISEDVVVRDIEGEIIIIPLVAGIGDMDDDLYTLNDIGRRIWEKIDGVRDVQKIVAELEQEYDASSETIAQDILGFLSELLRRKMIVRVV